MLTCIDIWILQNKQFYQYKDDYTEAINLAAAKDFDGFSQFCANQVLIVPSLLLPRSWNKHFESKGDNFYSGKNFINCMPKMINFEESISSITWGARSGD